MPPKHKQPKKSTKKKTDLMVIPEPVPPVPDPLGKCDDLRFVHNKDRTRYYDQLKKPILMERKFDAASYGTPVHNMFIHKQWDYFLEEPGIVYEEMVREFYANLASSNEKYHSWVRGKTIIFSPERIASLCEFPKIAFEDCEFQGFKVDENYSSCIKDVNQVLCEDEVEWRWKAKKPYRLSITATHLRINARGIHKLVCNRILPTTHESEVDWIRGMMDCCILRGEDVDLGEALSSSILEVAAPSSNASLILPSLITALCLAEKVEIQSSERAMQPTSTINLNRMAKSARDVKGKGKRRRTDEDEEGQFDLAERLERYEEQLDGLRDAIKEVHSLLLQESEARKAFEEKIFALLSRQNDPIS